MSFQKICSFFPPAEGQKVPIRYGDQISWHFACFKDLMTENSIMKATSYITGEQVGLVGTRGDWLLEQIQGNYFVGEMSIWEKDDIIYFVRVISRNGLRGRSYWDCERVVRNIAAFANRVKDEAKTLGGGEQLKEAEEEIHEFSCVSFKDHWLGENSALLDIETYGGIPNLVNIRRGYTQGCWALALRRLGRVVRESRTV